MEQQTLAALHKFFPAAADFDPKAVTDLFDLADLVESIERRIRELAEETGMPALHFFMLEQLALNGGAASLGDLLKALVLPKQSATYILDHLEKEELVERRKSESDRRRIEIALTPKGRRRVKAKFGPFYSTLLGAVQNVSAHKRAQAVGALEQLREALEPSGDESDDGASTT